MDNLLTKIAIGMGYITWFVVNIAILIFVTHKFIVHVIYSENWLLFFFEFALGSTLFTLYFICSIVIFKLMRWIQADLFPVDERKESK